jgi:hypothetical protein
MSDYLKASLSKAAFRDLEKVSWFEPIAIIFKFFADASIRVISQSKHTVSYMVTIYREFSENIYLVINTIDDFQVNIYRAKFRAELGSIELSRTRDSQINDCTTYNIKIRNDNHSFNTMDEAKSFLRCAIDNTMLN